MRSKPVELPPLPNRPRFRRWAEEVVPHTLCWAPGAYGPGPRNEALWVPVEAAPFVGGYATYRAPASDQVHLWELDTLEGVYKALGGGGTSWAPLREGERRRTTAAKPAGIVCWYLGVAPPADLVAELTGGAFDEYEALLRLYSPVLDHETANDVAMWLAFTAKTG